MHKVIQYVHPAIFNSQYLNVYVFPMKGVLDKKFQAKTYN